MNRTPASVSSHVKQFQSKLASKLVDSQWSKTWDQLPDGLALEREGGKFASRGGLEQPEIALFAPLHYEPRYAYPLIIWLHSDGGNECELRRVMPHVSLRNHIAVAVRGTTGADPATAPPTLRKHEPSQGQLHFRWPQSPAEIVEASTRVAHAIRLACQRYHVHPQRIFLAGYEGGGTMALRLALASPEQFAGAISLEGPMPTGDSPLRCVNRARRLPLMLASCRDSNFYPDHRVADDLRLLHAAGFALSLRQYPGEHELTTEMLADLDRWILERFCGQASA